MELAWRLAVPLGSPEADGIVGARMMRGIAGLRLLRRVVVPVGGPLAEPEDAVVCVVRAVVEQDSGVGRRWWRRGAGGRGVRRAAHPSANRSSRRSFG